MELKELNILREMINQLIDNIIIRIEDVIEKYDNKELKELMSNDRIIFLLEDLSTLAEGIDIVEENNQEILLEELTEKIGLLYKQMKIKDELSFKDILEFELKTLLEHWKDNI